LTRRGCDPHSAHYPTECPANLKAEIQPIRELAAKMLLVV